MTGDVDGSRATCVARWPEALRPEHLGRVLAAAGAGKRGVWTTSAGDFSYELRGRSAWPSEMELRSGGVTVGSIRTARAPRGKIPVRAAIRALAACAGLHRAIGSDAVEPCCRQLWGSDVAVTTARACTDPWGSAPDFTGPASM